LPSSAVDRPEAKGDDMPRQASARDGELLNAIERWKQIAVDTIDDIGGWREAAGERESLSRENPLFAWPKDPPIFRIDTMTIIAALPAEFANMNVAAVEQIYIWCNRWLERQSPEGLPDQRVLVETLDLAMLRVNALDNAIIGRFVHADTNEAREMPVLTDALQDILDAIRESKKPLSAKQIAEESGRGESTVKAALKPLGLLRRKCGVGHTHGAGYFHRESLIGIPETQPED